jgi:hypothetical protein
VRKELCKRLPRAHELVYDNYTFFVIGYGPIERPSDSILSIAAGAGGVRLCFIHGAKLPDPEKVLLGSGEQTRFVRLGSARVLARPAIVHLIEAAVGPSRAPVPGGQGRLLIRPVSAKQRPRRRAKRGRAVYPAHAVDRAHSRRRA